jgi:hypothetical protein
MHDDPVRAGCNKIERRAAVRVQAYFGWPSGRTAKAAIFGKVHAVTGREQVGCNPRGLRQMSCTEHAPTQGATA